jgi:hypothetical protein
MTSFSCKEHGGKFINQGEIHYNIDYIGNFGQMPKEVLPKNLIVSFKIKPGISLYSSTARR